jgi:hypothetical protein
MRLVRASRDWRRGPSVVPRARFAAVVGGAEVVGVPFRRCRPRGRRSFGNDDEAGMRSGALGLRRRSGGAAGRGAGAPRDLRAWARPARPHRGQQAHPLRLRRPPGGWACPARPHRGQQAHPLRLRLRDAVGPSARPHRGQQAHPLRLRLRDVVGPSADTRRPKPGTPSPRARRTTGDGRPKTSTPTPTHASVSDHRVRAATPTHAEVGRQPASQRHPANKAPAARPTPTTSVPHVGTPRRHTTSAHHVGTPPSAHPRRHPAVEGRLNPAVRDSVGPRRPRPGRPGRSGHQRAAEAVDIAGAQDEHEVAGAQAG